MASFDDPRRATRENLPTTRNWCSRPRCGATGCWLFGRAALGLSGADADAYGKALAMSAHEKHHEDDLVAKIAKDLAAKEWS